MGSRERRRQPRHRGRIRSRAMAARPRPATGKSRGALAGRAEAQSAAAEQASAFPELWETGGGRFGQLTRVDRATRTQRFCVASEYTGIPNYGAKLLGEAP